MISERFGAAPLLLAAALLVPAASPAVAGRFGHERVVIPGAAGPNRLSVDVPLLAAAKPLRYAKVQQPDGSLGLALLGGLEDLRLYDPSGREVEYLVIGPPVPSARWQEGSILPVLATKEESGFEADLGTAVRVDRLRLSGIPAPFLKRARLEGGGDRSHWAVLVADGTVFDLPDEHLQRTELMFAPGEFRYFRLTWNDRNSAPVLPPREVAARTTEVASGVAPLAVPIDFERRSSEPGKSRFRLHLPGAHLAITALELNCTGSYLLRPARISEPRLSGHDVVPVPLGAATLRRASRGDLVAADLRIPIMRPEGPDLDLVVEDGDNPPLELLTVSAELAPLPAIYFDTPTAATLTARFGDPQLPAPLYDIEAVRGSFGTLQFAEALWGEMRDVAPPTESVPVGSPLPATGARIDPSAFRYAREIPAGPAGPTALALDAGVLAHSANLHDLRIADVNGSQVPYTLERLDEPLAVVLDELQPIPATPAAGRANQSCYRLVLPYDSLPAAQLVLSTSARVFSRRLALRIERPPLDRRSEPRIETVQSVSWVHADMEVPAPPLTVGLPQLGVSSVQLVIDEGDNIPLPLSRPKLLLPAYRMRFVRSSADELRLLYGQPGLDAPRYDLALVASAVLGTAVHEIAPGPEISGSAVQVKHGTSSQTKVFWAALTLVVIVLLIIVARLVLKPEEPPTRAEM